MNNTFDIQIMHHAEQAEAACIEWLKVNGEEGREILLCIAAKTLAPLSNKDDLTDNEQGLLFMSQFALHGICNAWTTLQERKDDE